MAGVVAGVAQAAWRAAREFVGLGDESESQPAPLPGPERREEGGAQPTRRATALSAVGICVGALVVAATMLGNRRRRRQPGAQADRVMRTGRIPLKDVIRFKERQWFVEELEQSRDGDPNAMLRLSKMYLHGQGCQPNLHMAQEWLKKARYGGVGGTLDELFATDDPDPRGKLRRLLAEDEKRRGQRASKPSAAPAERLQQLRAQA